MKVVAGILKGLLILAIFLLIGSLIAGAARRRMPAHSQSTGRTRGDVHGAGTDGRRGVHTLRCGLKRTGRDPGFGT